MGPTDKELLREYCEGSQDAFRELVRRHLDMVFSAARRQTLSAAWAEEVTQSVFIKLARDACRIGTGTPLAAWLYAVTRNTAINAARTEIRRQRREHASVEIFAMSSPAPSWRDIEQLLDEAVADLRAVDRCAIILRFFEDKTLREVGEVLGFTEEAARKRVGRALEQLRDKLVKRGVTISGSVLATELSAHALQAAPATLSVAVLSGVAPPGVAFASVFTSALPMTTIQKTSFVAIAVIAAGIAIYQARTISRQSSENAALRQYNAQLAAARAATAGQRVREATTPPRESDVASSAATSGATAADRKLIATMSDWTDRAVRLRDLLKTSSMWVVPEFRLLNEIDWLDVAKDAKLDTEADVRSAFLRVRSAANQRVAAGVRAGLKAHAEARHGLLPTSVEELTPFFDSSVDPAMQLNPLNGSSLDVQTKNSILQRVLDSEWFDKSLTRGMLVGNGLPIEGSDTAKPPTVGASLAAFNQALLDFQQRNAGQRPHRVQELEPFLGTPMNAALLKMLFEISRDPSAQANASR
jgi:RNA polymerase sigma factor (sigma-70 family)